MRVLLTELFTRHPVRFPCVEIGAGDGQFTDLVASITGEPLTCIEVSAAAVETLRRRPSVRAAQQAAIESLPFTNGSVATIVGCCVLDVVADLPRAFAEMARVLPPGGACLHVLDMTTNLAPLLAELVESTELIALPNVVTDPCRAPWPEDVLVIPREQLDRVLGAIADERLRLLLERYRQLFVESADGALLAFDEAQGSPEVRAAMARAFRAAARQLATDTRGLAELAGHLLSSARLFHEHLLASAAPWFDVERAELVSATVPLAASTTSIRSIVGFTQSTSRPTSAAAATLGVHVFVASRR